MSKYKIVFIDIDGTLINEKQKVTPRTKKVISKLKEMGIYVVITSGRNSYQVRELSQSVNASSIIIASNGAEVYDYEKKLTIHQAEIPIPTLQNIFDFCNTHNLKLYLNSQYQRYINLKDTIPYPENILISSLDEIKGKISQIVIQSTNYNRMLVLKDYLHSLNPDLENTNSSVSLTNNIHIPNESLFRDFTPKFNTKSSGVAKVLEYLNLNPEEAISLGDSFNDLSMFELTGLSIAMGNAIEEIKEASDEITLTNDEDGVAVALEKIFHID